jgi:hypothetical protein
VGLSPQRTADLHGLLWSLRAGTATPEELTRLERLVCEDAQVRTFYVRYMHLCADLYWNHVGPEAAGHADDTQQNAGQSDQREMGGGELPASHAAPVVASPPPVLSLFDSIGQGAVGYFSSDWLAAYLIATVICGIGLAIGTVVHVSHPAQVVRQSISTRASNPQSPIPNPSPKAPLVGRITGMVDCKWGQSPESRVQGPALDPRLLSLVSLGDKFALASGLMEITYETGAKVVLQGPMTFEVDSRDGGFLSVGKLTARVERKVASGQWSVVGKSEMSSLATSSNPQSLIPNPLFAVRTPTATVTDLGTEFAVEVKPEGPVEVHVFEGQVETSRQARPDAAPLKQRLVAGEAIRFVSAAVSERIPVEPSPFAADSLRMITKARSSRLLVPVGLVATAYHRVWGVGGKLVAENDRQQAYRVVADGIFGRGENGQGPRSSFDTLDVNKSKTDFVGLLYGHRMRFDRIKVFCGRQSGDGGNWRELPRVFILKNHIDPGSAPPEDDPANWRAVPLCLSYGASFSAKADANPGRVLEFVLTIPANDRTGYGWAVGGVEGNGAAGYLSVTELRAYGEEATHDR